VTLVIQELRLPLDTEPPLQNPVTESPSWMERFMASRFYRDSPRFVCLHSAQIVGEAEIAGLAETADFRKAVFCVDLGFFGLRTAFNGDVAAADAPDAIDAVRRPPKTP
jgi:hypothetical protein